MPDKSILDMAPSVEVQMQVNLSRLDTVMAQMVLNIRDGMAAVKHVYCTAVTKTMDRVDVIQAFGRKGFFEILFADPVDAMTGERLPSLVDKEDALP